MRFVILRAMGRKNSTKAQMDAATESRPEKVLLHMAPKDGDWAGKATRFRRAEHFKFSSLKELVVWLRRLSRQ